MLLSGGVYASHSSACCMYKACKNGTTMLLRSGLVNVCSTRTNASDQNVSHGSGLGTGRRLVCHGFTTAASARGSTRIAKPLNHFFSTLKNGHLGTSEFRLGLVIKNYHLTPMLIYRKKENVAGERVKVPKLNPILKQDTIILIDEDGKNLGQMDSKMALGIAEGRGLSVLLVGNQRLSADNGREENIPVFRITGKKLQEENREMAKNIKKRSSTEIIKEVHFGTKITDHDMTYKLRHVVDILERGRSVRVFSEVRAKGKWMSSDVYGEELKKRESILGDVEERLKDIGVRVQEVKSMGKMMYAQFKPSPGVLQRRTERLKEDAESRIMKKTKKWQEKEERKGKGEEREVEKEEEWKEE